MENITMTYNWTGFISAYWWVLLITAAFAYLLGSVNFAIIFSSMARRRDIRKYGSGNAGATNVLRTFGPVLGGCTFVCDVLKGLAAVAAAGAAASYLVPGGDGAREVAAISGMACVFGHMFPVFFSFRGGKGVSTTLGVLFMLDWRVALSCLGVFIIATVCSRMVSLGSVCAAVAVPVATLGFSYTEGITPRQRLVCVLAMAAVCIAVIIKHSSNIARIAAGKESRLSFGSKKKRDGKAAPREQDKR